MGCSHSIALEAAFLECDSFSVQSHWDVLCYSNAFARGYEKKSLINSDRINEQLVSNYIE